MAAAGLEFLHLPLQLLNRARFFKLWLRTNRASHPSGSSDQRYFAFALAALPPQKNIGATSCPNGYHRFMAADFSGQPLAGSRCRRSVLLLG